MLMRYASLDRQGNYKPSPHAKLGYGTMVLVRSNIVYMSSIALAKAVTIAVRYSAQRRQFALGGGDAETPVLDYAMQQHRLLPLVAAAYAFRVTAFTVRELYIELSEALKKHDTSLLPEMHATSAGLKSLVTTLVGAGIDECRQCCGGHGYSRLSGLPDLFADFLPNQTAEGDNYLLSQQVGRYLLKAAQSVVAGKPLAGGVRYLERGQALLDERCAPDADLRDPEVLVALFRHRVARLLFALAEQMQLLIGGGASAAEAWNQSLVDVWRLSCAHGMETIVSSFASTVRSAAPALQQVLRRLLALFALAHVEREQGDWLEDGYLREAHCRRVRVEVRALLTELRPDAVALVDAFNFSDVDLGSAIGSTDGYAYRKLYEAAQREPLNQTPVDSGFMQYVHPLISSRL
jgi:acyl-CoA oxidase